MSTAVDDLNSMIPLLMQDDHPLNANRSARPQHAPRGLDVVDERRGLGNEDHLGPFDDRCRPASCVLPSSNPSPSASTPPPSAYAPPVLHRAASLPPSPMSAGQHDDRCRSANIRSRPPVQPPPTSPPPFSPGSAAFSPGSAAFSPGSAAFSPGSAAFSPGSAAFSPGSTPLPDIPRAAPSTVKPRPPGPTTKPAAALGGVVLDDLSDAVGPSRRFDGLPRCIEPPTAATLAMYADDDDDSYFPRYGERSMRSAAKPLPAAARPGRAYAYTGGSHSVRSGGTGGVVLDKETMLVLGNQGPVHSAGAGVCRPEHRSTAARTTVSSGVVLDDHISLGMPPAPPIGGGNSVRRNGTRPEYDGNDRQPAYERMRRPDQGAAASPGILYDEMDRVDKQAVYERQPAYERQPVYARQPAYAVASYDRTTPEITPHLPTSTGEMYEDDMDKQSASWSRSSSRPQSWARGSLPDMRQQQQLYHMRQPDPRHLTSQSAMRDTQQPRLMAGSMHRTQRTSAGPAAPVSDTEPPVSYRDMRRADPRTATSGGVILDDDDDITMGDMFPSRRLNTVCLSSAPSAVSTGVVLDDNDTVLDKYSSASLSGARRPGRSPMSTGGVVLEEPIPTRDMLAPSTNSSQQSPPRNWMQRDDKRGSTPNQPSSDLIRSASGKTSISSHSSGGRSTGRAMGDVYTKKHLLPPSSQPSVHMVRSQISTTATPSPKPSTPSLTSFHDGSQYSFQSSSSSSTRSSGTRRAQEPTFSGSDFGQVTWSFAPKTPASGEVKGRSSTSSKGSDQNIKKEKGKLFGGWSKG